VDEINIGPLELVENLTGLRGQTLHILSIALRVEGIEGE
jgi:hypothetical protein